MEAGSRIGTRIKGIGTIESEARNGSGILRRNGIAIWITMTKCMEY